jgi:hypothetical protein
MMGMPRRVLSAAFCILVIICCHVAADAFSDGGLPPPLSTLPAAITPIKLEGYIHEHDRR